MPLYEYRCTECNEIFEVLHKINEEYQDGCPKCHAKVNRILSPSHFILKGAGFYVNDYPSESRKKAESSDKAGSSDKAESNDKAKSSKTEPHKSKPAKEERTETAA